MVDDLYVKCEFDEGAHYPTELTFTFEVSNNWDGFQTWKDSESWPPLSNFLLKYLKIYSTKPTRIRNMGKFIQAGRAREDNPKNTAMEQDLRVISLH